MKGRKLKDLLKNIPDDADILIGDEDPIGRSDLNVEKIVKKKYGFDESNDQYYVLVTHGVSGGCFI